jgi:PAS domain-containing protein
MLELAEGIVSQLGAAVRNACLHEEQLRLEAAAAAAHATAVERERAAQILDAVGDGIFSVDAAGAVTFWNHAAERIANERSAPGRGATFSVELAAAL